MDFSIYLFFSHRISKAWGYVSNDEGGRRMIGGWGEGVIVRWYIAYEAGPLLYTIVYRFLFSNLVLYSSVVSMVRCLCVAFAWLWPVVR